MLWNYKNLPKLWRYEYPELKLEQKEGATTNRSTTSKYFKAWIDSVAAVCLQIEMNSCTIPFNWQYIIYNFKSLTWYSISVYSEYFMGFLLVFASSCWQTSCLWSCLDQCSLWQWRADSGSAFVYLSLRQNPLFSCTDRPEVRVTMVTWTHEGFSIRYCT